MMRRIYKSRLFWLGVPGLVFLLWVWWDSGMYGSRVYHERGREVWQVEVSRGSVVGLHALDLMPAGSAKVGTGTARFIVAVDEGPRSRRQFDFRPTYEGNARRVRFKNGAWGIDKEYRTMGVALWVMVLGYVVLWLGVVFAWQWRQARVMRGLTDAVREREVMG